MKDSPFISEMLLWTLADLDFYINMSLISSDVSTSLSDRMRGGLAIILSCLCEFLLVSLTAFLSFSFGSQNESGSYLSVLPCI
jgi:hypothetical protein